jgi:predicted trehalose synthase
MTDQALETIARIANEMRLSAKAGAPFVGQCTTAAIDGWAEQLEAVRVSLAQERGAWQRAVEIIRDIIYASDGCVGHRDCNHSIKPWKDARAFLDEFYFKPAPPAEATDAQEEQP